MEMKLNRQALTNLNYLISSLEDRFLNDRRIEWSAANLDSDFRARFRKLQQHVAKSDVGIA